MDTSLIRENMDVIASDGERVGSVAAVRGERLAVRPARGGPAGSVPLDWISRIDEQVHLRHGGAVARGEIEGLPEPPPEPTEGRLKGPMVIGCIFLVIAVALLVWALFYGVG